MENLREHSYFHTNKYMQREKVSFGEFVKYINNIMCRYICTNYLIYCDVICDVKINNIIIMLIDNVNLQLRFSCNVQNDICIHT